MPTPRSLLIPAALLALATTPAGAAAAGWSAPRTLGASNADTNGQLHTALNARGEAVAAWPTPPAGVAVAVAQRAPHFGAARVLTRRGIGPSVAIGADGTALVAWTQGRLVMAAVRLPGHGFGKAVRLSGPLSAPRSDDFAVTAIAGDGTLLVAWEQLLTAQSQTTATVVSAQARPGASFSAPTVFGATDFGTPSLAAASDGSATLGFTFEGRVMAARRAAGGVFTPSAPVSPAGERASWQPLVVGPAGGGSWVAWADNSRVRAAFASTLTFAAPVSGPPAHVSEITATALDGSAIGLLWRQRVPHRPFGFPYRSLHAVVARPDGSVSATVTLRGAPGVAGPLAVGLAGGDALVLAYQPVGPPAAFRAVRFTTMLLAADGSVTPLAAPGGLHSQRYPGLFEMKTLAAAGRRALVMWQEGHRVRVSARTIPTPTTTP